MFLQGANTEVYNIASKDYEFLRRMMEEHWKAGYDDMARALRHPAVLQRPRSPDGVFTFELPAQELAQFSDHLPVRDLKR
jgi:NTE family protein